MSSYWEIIESRRGRERKSEVDEAYECGYAEGYEAAMQEQREHEDFGERRHMSYRGEPERMRDEREFGERRSRDRMGRYR